MTTLYLIRHAEAEGNLYRRIHGQFDTNVTPNGRRQIAALARRFAAVPVDAVYASDLTRTQTTAQAIAAPQGLPLRLEPGFREINLGVWEDRAFGWLYAFETAQIQCFNQDPRHWQVEGSETFEHRPVYCGPGASGQGPRRRHSRDLLPRCGDARRDDGAVPGGRYPPLRQYGRHVPPV